MKMRYGSKFDLSIDNQSVDNSKFMSDVKVMNKISPDDHLTNNELEFQEEQIETQMELEEKIKRDGIQIGKELEDKYNLSDL